MSNFKLQLFLYVFCTQILISLRIKKKKKYSELMEVQVLGNKMFSLLRRNLKII